MTLSFAILAIAMLAGATSAAIFTLEIRTRFDHYARQTELRKRLRTLGKGDSPNEAAPNRPVQALLIFVRLSHEKPLVTFVDWADRWLARGNPRECRPERSEGSTVLIKSGRGLGRKTTPVGDAQAHVPHSGIDSSHLIDQADLTQTFTTDDLERARIVSTLVIGLGGALVLSALISLFAGLVGLIAGVYLGFKFPARVITRAATTRVEQCVAQLPHMIEVISLGSTAGASFVSSLDLYCTRFEGPLPEEMRRVTAAWKTGAQSWEQALAEFAQRIDSIPVTHFVSTVTQAIKLGAPMAQMLEAQSVEARRSKRAQIEEKIEKAPVKMLLPMGTLVLPAMLLLILGPVLLGMST